MNLINFPFVHCSSLIDAYFYNIIPATEKVVCIFKHNSTVMLKMPIDLQMK